ncbi:MAG: sigma-70 family RNA polymerase sigma factor [Clostridia bacterium]|nr:sigma-70 family RNA polymerase sigma factor [Clostridia bacterium]
MDDATILALYNQRDECAIAATREKYGALCHTIAYRILSDHGEAEECEADTYFTAWQKIPPTVPQIFSAFLAKITRTLALDRYRKSHAQKRGGSTVEVSLEELADCLPTHQGVEDKLEADELAKAISAFLRTIPARDCDIFLRRYWYFDTIDEICRRYDLGASKVKMTLHRTRIKLAAYLSEEEWTI